LLEVVQVEGALRAQVMWGARLGTNLVELGYIDLDGLSRALGRQRDLPAALARHFEKADRELQARLDPSLANAWSIVPLLRVAGGKIAIAAMDVISPATRAAIAAALAVAPSEIVVSIAAEQRVKYQLERVYGIERSARFLRAKGRTTASLPKLALGEVPIAIDDEVSVEVDIDVQTDTAIPEPIPHLNEPSLPAAEALEALIEEAAATAELAPTGEPTGRDRRTYVKTLDEASATLARIAIKKVAPVSAVESSGSGATLDAATRAIRRGPNRDRVADLVIEALERFAPMCSAAMMMVVRGDIAIGWKHFSRDGAVSADLAVPLDQPGLVAATIASDQTQRASARDLAALDGLLLRALGSDDGDLVIVPVPIGTTVMCMIASAIGEGEPVAAIEAIATAASTAFARLVRDASR
jgi:hypothetical protein